MKTIFEKLKAEISNMSLDDFVFFICNFKKCNYCEQKDCERLPCADNILTYLMKPIIEDKSEDKNENKKTS